MSVELVQEQMFKFLVSDKPEVLAIKGAWGLGKTYCWNEFIELKKYDCALKSYSYVSLFGANSLNDIKQLTFLNTIDTKNIGESPNIKGYSRKIADFIKDTKIPYVSKYVGGIGSLIDSVSQLAMSRTIICFDDLERHSKGVTMKDFMGLVSYFKEQKQCKVVLLLNEDTGDETFVDYMKYKEKVVDKQLHFEPTAEECFDSIFCGEDPVTSYARSCCLRLNIKNRRIICKIESHIKDCLSSLRESHFDKEIEDKIIRSLVLQSWCYYSVGSSPYEVPSFDYISSPKPLGYGEGDAELEKRVKVWSSILQSYGYGYTDKIDLVLAEGVKKGFFDVKRLLFLCSQRQKEIDVERQSERLNSAWKLFHASFDDNEVEVIQAMDEGLRDIVNDATIYQYGQALSLLRKLSPAGAQRADELITLFIESRQSTPDVFNVDNAFGTQDEVFKDRLREAHKKHFPERTVDQILETRRKQHSYDQLDVEILNRLNESEIKSMFLGFKGDDLYDYINVFILLSSSSQELRDKVDNALTQIASSSPLNTARMAKFRR
ncbi:hypothetical protein ACJO1Z_09115 [Vibrio parahaemolyticus]|uniref:hypothetical protein n=1 Tax=Vibrio parahaemolyticus TaxID=670 RepID=UPI00387B58C6